jgi:hypothetical protein
MRCADCQLPIDPWEHPTEDGDVVVHHDCDIDAVIAAREWSIEQTLDLMREDRI